MKNANNEVPIYTQVKTLGELLKNARKDKKISIREMSAKTKIRVTQLIHLENNNLSKLPCKTYVIGFLKSIADVLEIDPKVTVELFEKSLSEELDKIITMKEKKHIVIDLKVISNGLPLFFKNQTKFIIKTMMFTVALFIASIVLFLLIFQFDNLDHKKNVISHTVESLIKEKTVLLPSLKPSSVSPVQVQAKVFEPENVNLSINAIHGASWIAFKVDKKPIIQFTLVEGKSIFLKGGEIRLLVGNYKALRIVQNNIPVVIKKSSTSLTANLIFSENLNNETKKSLFVFNDDGTALIQKHVNDNDKEI